jgi:uncharacterized protein YndB with AHSA1/START domain
MSAITLSRSFDASPEQVWAALTDKNQLKQWYFDIPDFAPVPGTVFDFYEGPAREYLHRGKVLAAEPNRRLQHTWMHPSHSKGESVLTWEIAPDGERTKVTLHHEGTENFAGAGPAFSRANYEAGWDALLNIQLRNHLYGIKKYRFEVDINAPAAKVWQLMWDAEGYKRWTAPFSAGSYAEGNFEQGGEVRFLTPDGSGMYSKVLYTKAPQKIILSHIGEIKNGKPLPVDAAAERWTGCLESYTYTENNGVTHLLAEVDIEETHGDYMQQKFPPSMQEVKKMCEE